MTGGMYERTTICARATAPGQGAIAVVRISGPEAVDVLDRVYRPIVPDGGGSAVRASGFKAREMHYGKIVYPALKSLRTEDCGLSDEACRSGEEVIDEVMAVVFRAPRSFTGEDSAEIYCHGSQYIVSEILKALISAGAVMASAGEFTKRAFLNGRMDLAQAEAVADLIASENRAAHDVALRQMRGGYSSELGRMRDEMLEIVSLMELELDFSEEDVEFADRTKLLSLMERVMEHISGLADSFAIGNAIRNGIPVAIVGAVNTGKSTLLNALLGEERAIVSDIEGTTRDTVEDTMNIGGNTFRFIDTAGIRETSETIESIGISRTFDAIGRASVVLLMLDAARPETFRETLAAVAARLSGREKLFVLLNKIDLLSPALPEVEKAMLEEVGTLCNGAGLSPAAIIPMSARMRRGMDSLTSALSSVAEELGTDTGATLVTNLRHYQALKDGLEALSRARTALAEGISTEFVTQDIREALYHLGSITGQITSDEILTSVFSRFCIGK